MANTLENISPLLPTNLLPQEAESLPQRSTETLENALSSSFCNLENSSSLNISTSVTPLSTLTVSAPVSSDLTILESPSNRQEKASVSTNSQKSNRTDDKSNNSKTAKKSKSKDFSSRTSRRSTKDSNSQSSEGYRSKSRGSSSKESKSSSKRSRSRSRERYRSKNKRSRSKESKSFLKKSRSRSRERYPRRSRSVSQESLSFSTKRQKYSSSVQYNAPLKFHKFLIKGLICPKSNCAVEFKNQYEMTLHLQDTHTCLPYECPIDECDLKFRTP